MELKDVWLISNTITFVTLYVNRNIFDDPKAGYLELFFLCFIEENQSFFSFAELESEIWS